MKYPMLVGFALGAGISGLSAYLITRAYYENLLKIDMEQIEEEKPPKMDIKDFSTVDTNTYSSSNGYVTSSIASVIPDNMTIIPPPDISYIPKECLPSDNDQLDGGVERLYPGEDPDFPYLISDDTYVDTKENYGKDVLHYYAGDGVIADDELEAIIHPEMLVGDNIREYFDNLLETEHFADAIYIRNDQISRDFEIIYHDEKFFC